MSHTSDKYRCCKNPGLSVSNRAPAPKRKNISFLHTSTHTRTLQLTPRSSVLLEKLAVPQLIKTFSAFYGKRRILQCSQQPAICPYYEPDKSSLRSHQISLISILILFPDMLYAFQVVSLLQVSTQKPYTRPSLPHVSHSSSFDHPNSIW